MRLLRQQRHGLERVLRREQAECMQRWRDVLQQHAAIRSGLKHMLNRELSRGWGGFQAQRAVGLDKRRRQQRCLAHAALREVSIGWRTWCEYANSCHTFLDELHEGLKHLVNRNLRAGLNTWVAVVEEKREEQARLA